jgi:hypothetical protein
MGWGRALGDGSTVFGTGRPLGGSAEQRGGGELGETGPGGDVEGGVRVGGVGVLGVVLAELIEDTGESGLLKVGVVALPEEAEALTADGAEDIGVRVRRMAQNLHWLLLFK